MEDHSRDAARQDPLDGVRKQIDEVDIKIRELFLERMNLARQVAQVKAGTEDRIYKPDRENAILQKRCEGMDESLLLEYRALLRRIMEVSRKYQYGLTLQMRDCFPFSFTQEDRDIRNLAMLREEVFICSFCSRDEVQAAGSYQEIGDWIAQGRADCGAGIIEKVGRGVSDELNMLLMENALYVNRCAVINAEDGRYKLAAFGPELTVLPDHNRLKIVFICPNRSGALASILSMIADYEVNLTEIHSIPYCTETAWNYRFFAELEANLLSPKAQALAFQLSQETEEFRILGSYRCEGDF